MKPKIFSVIDVEPYEKGGKPLDMDRMQLVIRRRMLEQLSHLEINHRDTLAFMVGRWGRFV